MIDKNDLKCRVCSNKINVTIDFGMMPIANNLLPNTIEAKDNEFKFHMQTATCGNCGCFQVVNVPDKNLMFNENYAYFASQSLVMQDHFRTLGDYIIKEYIKRSEDYVLDLGSNDGIFLKNFASKKIKHIGIDASENVVKESQAIGVNAVSGFFDRNLTTKIKNKMGKAKVIVSTNTMHHIENCNEVADGMNNILHDDGIIIIEDPYLVDMLELASFEQIYAEHNFIWCLNSYKKLFAQHSIYLNKVEHFPLHGGSMRYFFSRKNYIDDSVKEFLDLEEANKVKEEITYINFKNKCELVCKNLKKFLEEKKTEGKKVCGYGATAKSTTILNYANIDNSLINVIYDSTPIKKNKLTPGTHIPIRDPEKFINDNYDYTVLFAWNHKDEIMRKEIKNGSKTTWVEYIPEIHLSNES